MKSLSRWCLFVLALALGLGGCASIEHRPASSSLPEPPPWNSLEMMMMETEIVWAEDLGAKPLPLITLQTLG